MQDSRSLPKETSSQDSRDRWTKTGLIATCPLFGLLSTKERCWSTAIVAFIVPIPIFLMGFTFAFASSATLDLTGDATELPPGYILPTHFISIFVVSGLSGSFSCGVSIDNIYGVSCVDELGALGIL